MTSELWKPESPILTNQQDYFASAPQSFATPTPQELGEKSNDSLTSPVRSIVPIVTQTFGADVGSTDQLLALSTCDCAFNVKSVTIDNASGQWFYCVQINQFIPPWTHGMVRNLISGAAQLQFAALTPTSRSSAPVSGQRITVIACSINQPPTDGVDSSEVNFSGVVSGTVTANGSISASAGTGWNPIFDPSVTNVAETIKASAGKLGGLVVYNPGAVITYLQIYDAAVPVVGTTTPVAVIPVFPGGVGTIDGGNAGIAFANAITYAATTTPTGAGAPAAAVQIMSGEWI